MQNIYANARVCQNQNHIINFRSVQSNFSCAAHRFMHRPRFSTLKTHFFHSIFIIIFPFQSFFFVFFFLFQMNFVFASDKEYEWKMACWMENIQMEFIKWKCIRCYAQWTTHKKKVRTTQKNSNYGFSWSILRYRAAHKKYHNSKYHCKYFECYKIFINHKHCNRPLEFIGRVIIALFTLCANFIFSYSCNSLHSIQMDNVRLPFFWNEFYVIINVVSLEPGVHRHFIIVTQQMRSRKRHRAGDLLNHRYYR